MIAFVPIVMPIAIVIVIVPIVMNLYIFKADSRYLSSDDFNMICF